MEPIAGGAICWMVSLDDIAKILDGFCDHGTMWLDGEQDVSLAVSFAPFLQSRGTANIEEAINNISPSATRRRLILLERTSGFVLELNNCPSPCDAERARRKEPGWRQAARLV